MTAALTREMLAVLSELIELNPDVRLGQLMAQLGELSQDRADHSLWDVEDDELLAVMQGHRAELLAWRAARDEREAVPVTADAS